MDDSQEKMNRLYQVMNEILASPIETPEDITQEELEKFYSEFQYIYSNHFRHWYSQVSGYLGKKTPDVYSTLDSGLRLISEYGKTNHADSDEVNEGIDKLLDHICLESVRNDRMEAVKCITGETKKFYNDILSLSTNIQKEAQKAHKDIEHYHEQSIAILGIFAAVVLAFMGGISFTGGVLENFGTVSFFRLVITIALLGFVVINTLFVLLEFVLQIVYRGHKGTHGINFLRWIAVLNIILAVIVILTIGVYFVGWGSLLESWAAAPK